MGLASSTGKDNDELVDNMIESELIRQKEVELSFRLVDRGRFFPDEERDSAYKDTAWKSKNSDTGPLHISAPCIYANVIEHLHLSRGLSFLNLGSGTGYLNTVVGFLIGSGGYNHGVELQECIVNYAVERVADTLKTDEMAAFDWCVPEFFCGNALLIDPSCFGRYDRVYCGAAVPDSHRIMLCSLLKVGGICIMPFQEQLQRITRMSEDRFDVKNITSVSFADFVVPLRDDLQKLGTLKLPAMKKPSLQDLCRDKLRAHIREVVVKNVTLKIREKCSLTSDSYQEPLTSGGSLNINDRPPPFVVQQDRPTISVHQTAPAPIPRNDIDNEDEPQHLMAIFDEVETDANGNALLVRPQMPHLPRIIRVMNERVAELGGPPLPEERNPDVAARMRPFMPFTAPHERLDLEEELILPTRVPERYRRPRLGPPFDRQAARNTYRAYRDRFMATRHMSNQLNMDAESRSAEEDNDVPESEPMPDQEEAGSSRTVRSSMIDIENGLAAEDAMRVHDDELPPFPDEGPPPEGEEEDDDREEEQQHADAARDVPPPYQDPFDFLRDNRPINLQNLLDHGNIRFRIEFRHPNERMNERDDAERRRSYDRMRADLRSIRERHSQARNTANRRPLIAEMSPEEIMSRHHEMRRQDDAFFEHVGRLLDHDPITRRQNRTGDAPSSSSSSSATSSSSGRSSVKRPRPENETDSEAKKERRSPSTSTNEDEGTNMEAEESDSDRQQQQQDQPMEASSSSSSSGLGVTEPGENTSTGPLPLPRDPMQGHQFRMRNQRVRRYTANRRAVEPTEEEQNAESAAREQARAEQIESIQKFREAFDKYLNELPLSQKMRRFMRYGMEY